jgi:hypothetical protein
MRLAKKPTGNVDREAIKEERARDGAKAMAEYLAKGRAVREKTARLRALRLAKEEAERSSSKPAASRKK